MGLSSNLRGFHQEWNPTPFPASCCPLGKRKARSRAEQQPLPGSGHRNWGLPVQLLALSVLLLLIFCLQSLEGLNILNRFKCIVEVFNYMCNKGLNIFLQKNKTGFQPQMGTSRSSGSFWVYFESDWFSCPEPKHYCTTLYKCEAWNQIYP